MNIIVQQGQPIYPRLAAATPDDPADIYQENETLRLMVEDLVLDRLENIHTQTEEQKAHTSAVLAALFGYQEGGAA